MRKSEKIIISISMLIFLVVGIFIMQQNLISKTDCTEETIATIVDVYVHSPGAELPNYYPILEYEIGGEIYKHKTTVNTAYRDDMLGEKVKLYYNPNNPSEASLENEKIGSVILGGGFIFISLFILFGVFKTKTID